MEMRELVSNNHYKVMEVSLNSNESMPRHKATSDAFIIVKEGIGKLIFEDREVNLLQGTTMLIPGNKEHKLEVKDKFKACIVFASGANIVFA